MAFKMKGSPLHRNFGSALKTKSYSAHVHRNSKTGEEAWHTKDGEPDPNKKGKNHQIVGPNEKGISKNIKKSNSPGLTVVS